MRLYRLASFFYGTVVPVLISLRGGGEARTFMKIDHILSFILPPSISLAHVSTVEFCIVSPQTRSRPRCFSHGFDSSHLLVRDDNPCILQALVGR